MRDTKQNVNPNPLRVGIGAPCPATGWDSEFDRPDARISHTLRRSRHPSRSMESSGRHGVDHGRETAGRTRMSTSGVVRRRERVLRSIQLSARAENGDEGAGREPDGALD